MKKVLRFPDGFLWGAATSAHQVEGGLLNDWTLWEKEYSQKWRDDAYGQFGKTLLWGINKEEASEVDSYISGKAINHYENYKQDILLAKSLGHSAYRFSLDWARIEPEEGNFNEGALRHYGEVVEECKKNGIEPFVTLWHWPLPLWLRDQKGFLSKNSPEYFERFARKVVQTFGSRVSFWITLNEPEIYTFNGYIQGKWPPGEKSILKARTAFKNLAHAHNLSYDVIKENNKKAQIGISKHNIYFESSGSFSSFVKKIADSVWNFYFLNLIKGKQDFIGLNYYFHNRIKGIRFNQNENKKVSDMGWELFPKGLYMCLKQLKRYGVPIYITEHGLADRNDIHREWYMKESLAWVHRAIEEGILVKGYLHWSLFDNFEWDKGFWPRFGLIEVDRKTLERKPRKSAYVYKEIAESNSLSL